MAHLSRPHLCDSKYFDLPTDLEISMYQNFREYQGLVEKVGGPGSNSSQGRVVSQASGIPAGGSIEIMNRLQKYVSANELNH